ncbi:peptide-methionine (S)-S-oxide reductase MsrA [Actinomyces bowdenii]|uniref:Peptide methionine sulfoxide reductase MsrA n=1 Tax=Actinomyces bowdenii TaxID=131109 RepID=A0A853EJY9_9ACTO|nr:peptide-methionine (S)-S-oxide reductase MsrA [Actinomyces bowdenii]MBF0696912.1 peptide-methionine (S)-S-oxide reductase MsrA [Actinomyces bowdenii]NYS69085.1 peptide-methionine (S)-S-oxide reductase MsrA [Actinomyces bowdenii]
MTAPAPTPARNPLLPGRERSILPAPGTHVVLGTPIDGPWPEGAEAIYLAAGCFWGVERILWRQEGVISTAVGYMGGTTPNPTYQEICTGATDHAETVRVIYDPAVCGQGGDTLLRTFWENHDSTRLNRHGNDVGTQYRSAVWTTTPAQQEAALRIRQAFQDELTRLRLGTTVTTVAPVEEVYADFGGPFYLAEDYHQGYLHKNPGGYCNHGPNGVTCPVGITDLPAQTEVLSPDRAPRA